MKITLYTINDCQFCKQEKEYLASHNMPFEEKNLENNREYLAEMLSISNNFAGTPVTKIEKDNGETSILKGFTREEFDEALGFIQPANVIPQVAAPAAPVVPVPGTFTPPAVPTAAPMPVPPAPLENLAMNTPAEPAQVSIPELVIPEPTASQPDPLHNPDSLLTQSPMPEPPSIPPAPVMPEPSLQMTTMPQPQAPVAEPFVPNEPPSQPMQPAAQSTPQDAALNSILSELQSKVGVTEPQITITPPSSPTPPPAGLPTIPEPDFKDAQ